MSVLNQMTDTSVNSKRIAKNTILLYGRTLFIMAITLYTSRVVLNTLGVTDYGIYNVIGGIVAMFSVISGSLSTSISRFITFEIGHGDYKRLKRIFSTSVNIQIGISLIVFLLAELVGTWFLNTKMNIPTERIEAANWVLHCSLLSFIISLISVPYNACIIAHERMSAFAYISIIEAILKLIVVYMLFISSYDKLTTYAILLVVVSLLIRLMYTIYCHQHFEESHYAFIHDKALVKEMTSFASWSFFGNGAYMLNTQGVDMLINIFFGVTLNAARGVTGQVQHAVMQFVNNFMVAINPQITKSYAAGELEYMNKLICKGAKYSYFLTLLFVVPIICEAEYILKLWLKIVPNYAPTFLRLTLLGALVSSMGNTLYTGVFATGNIKKYQLYITIVGCMVFPLTWIAFKMGLPAATSYVIYIIIYYVLVFVRLAIAKRILIIPVRTYLKEVTLLTAIVTLVAFILPLSVIYMINSSFMRLCITTSTALFSTFIGIYFIGLGRSEKEMMISKIMIMLTNIHERIKDKKYNTTNHIEK